MKLKESLKNNSLFLLLNEYTSYIVTYEHLHKLMTKSKSQNPMNGQPMNGLVYQSIMNEYGVNPSLIGIDTKIQRAFTLNDEVMLRKILECEY